MRIIKDNLNSIYHKAIGVGLGNFDGIHIGHKKLIDVLIKECIDRNLHSMIYTFYKHPENIMSNKIVTPIITPTKYKVEQFNKFNLDYLYFEEFNNHYAKMSCNEFVQKVLVNKLNAKLVVVGKNFRFGYRASGDINTLIELAKYYDIHVVIVDFVYKNNEIVSSTCIRAAILNGDIEKANDYLGKDFVIEGRAIKSNSSIEIVPSTYVVVPKDGFYYVDVDFNSSCIAKIESKRIYIKNIFNVNSRCIIKFKKSISNIKKANLYYGLEEKLS